MPPKKAKRAKPKLGGLFTTMPIDPSKLKPIKRKAVKAGGKLKRKAGAKLKRVGRRKAKK